MADEARAQHLAGWPPERPKPGGLRALRGGRAPGHDFNDPDLYGRMHRECRRIYTRAFGAISDSDWNAAFNFAYGQCWRSERDKGPIDRLAAWLTTAAHNSVVSEHRKTARVDPFANEDLLTEQTANDLTEIVEDRRLLRDAISCLKTSLPERARIVWTMRFAGDFEPSEIQRRLQISKKAYEKDLELASSLVISRLNTVRESGICETPDMTSMVRAYAIWGEEHGAERAKLAREHLDQCSACRRTVFVLRAAQRAAAFLPPPLLGISEPHSPALGIVMQTTKDLAGRIQDGLWRMTERVHDGLMRMKYGLIKLLSRGPASSPAGTDRTATVLGASGTGGAIATKAVVGCLAAGVLAGGTGACLKAAGVGVPGLNGLIHSITGSPHQSAHKSPSPRSVESTPTQNLIAMSSPTTMQGALVRPARPSRPTSTHLHVVRKATPHAPSTVMASRSEFGSPVSSPPQASPAEISAARNDFSSSPSHLARTASSNGATPTQAAPQSEPHTARASTKAAEGEFEGP
jgi:DNA-directed RNA polymerase specialized sigma24 family protein